MRNKVRPNQKALKGSIYHAQNKSKIKEEKGITLIVLLVTIILLVILASVAIVQITGDEGIITSTEVAVEEYDYQQYKERLEQLAHSIILADSLAGRTTTVTSMAEAMLNEAWIKEAVPNEESKDIIVTVDKGYMYQVYYDELTGMIDINGVGTEGGEGTGGTGGIIASLPTITASYDKENYTINATASCEDGISKIELIYKGEVVQVSNSDTASFEVEESGWYQVKATSSKGKTRYVSVRVSNEVEAPTIAVISTGAKENDWYGKDNVPVEVTISTEETNVNRIYYRKSTETDYSYVEGQTAKVTINTPGRTVIYAYAADSKGNESDIVRIEIKYDNVKPNAGGVAVSPEVPASGWYNTDVVVSLSNATDDTSGIAGYYYWEVTGDTAEVPEEEKTYVSGASKSLTIKSEGIRTIAFQAIDRAGNISGISNITIQKDSTNPKDFSLNIVNDSTTQFTVNTGTTDDTTYTNDVSGMSHYEIYIDGSLKETIEVTEESTPSISYVASELAEDTTYTVYVVAFDKAGNKTESASTTVSTSNVNQGGSQGGNEPASQLLAPIISLSGATPTNGYYKDNVTVTIVDSANASSSKAIGIKYQITGANELPETTIYDKTTTFSITEEGTSIITAWMIDVEGNESEKTTQTVSKDTTVPSTAKIEVTSYDRVSIKAHANGIDDISGVSSYSFQISPTINDEDFTTVDAIPSSMAGCDYTYEGLTEGTVYYIRVIVTDRAGNSTKSDIVRRITQDDGIEDEELSESIGKYVDYEPASGSFTSEAQYNGENDINLSTTANQQWQILFIDENTITLAVENPVHSNFTLKGANGYNNGVKLLNEACKAMYSNQSLGAVARSMDIDDIEAVSKYDKKNH